MSPNPRQHAQQMPYSEEAERAIIAAVLLEPIVNLPKVSTLLRPRDFYNPINRLVFSAYLEMEACGIPIDVVSLLDCLRSDPEEFDKCGGAAGISKLTDGFPVGINIEYHAGVVLRDAQQRRLLSAIANAQNALLSGNGHEETALAELHSQLEQSEAEIRGTETSRWRTVNCSNVEDWANVPPIEWCCEPLIPRGSFGFVGGGPKDGKSPLMIDLCIHMAQAQYHPPGTLKFLNRFPVRGEKILYVAKEDDLRRLNARWPDINQSYGYTEPPDLVFLPRKLTSMDLTKPEHIGWLKDCITRDNFSFIVLDVLSELIPYQDELKESNQVITSLKKLQDEFFVTLMILDHIRKPEQKKSGRGQQEANPFELRSVMRKYGASDYVFMLARTKEKNQLLFHYECKDGEAGEDLVLKRSPFGAEGPKHTIEATIEELAERARIRGEETALAILQAVPTDLWASPSSIAASIGMQLTERTVSRHLTRLTKDGQIQARGERRNRQYRRIPILEQESLPDM